MVFNFRPEHSGSKMQNLKSLDCRWEDGVRVWFVRFQQKCKTQTRGYGAASSKQICSSHFILFGHQPCGRSKGQYTDGRIVRTQRFFETKVRTHSKLEPKNFKIGSKFHFFLHKWLKTKKSLSRPCSRVSGKLCTKCCISYIKRTLDSRTHEVSKGKKCNFTCINDWKWRSLSVNPSHGPVGNYVRNAAFRT